MDPTVHFFAKLKKLAVTLESETVRLHHVFENRNNDGDSDTSARAMRAYHEINCDVGNLKGQIQEKLVEQKAWESEVSSFIKECRVMEQRISLDLQALKKHWVKYGYKAPKDSQRATSTQCQELEAEDKAADENDPKSAAEEGESQEDDRGGDAIDNHTSSSPSEGPPPVSNVLRTPQLSDFGLSELDLKRVLAGADWCSEVPPMPQISLPHSSLNTPGPPPMPITPKCALRMDDDELQTPQMHDFGISEHTMCLVNDFTVDLFLKNVQKPQRPPQDVPVPPVNSLMESFQAKDNLESPEPPTFCTPGFKIKNAKSLCSPPAQSNGHPGSPSQHGEVPSTPEMPAFKTPYLKQLVSSKKTSLQVNLNNRQPEDDNHISNLPTPPHNGSVNSKHILESSVPQISIPGVEDEQMPVMPNLQSVLANSLQIRSSNMLKKNSSEHEKSIKEHVSSLELDGPTQEFSLGTPRLRKDFQEPSTPEMPDLSSVTQDICKLVSQAQLKKTAIAGVQSKVRAEKGNESTLPKVPVVSESEFQSLPSYLKLMTLQNLNQAIHNINKFTAEYPGEKTEFEMEELRRITNVGTKTPVYVLCLTELKRLMHIGGAKNTSVYRLGTHN